MLLVLLDENFSALAIYEAERTDVIEALTKPGSRARNERNAMSMTLFKRIGRKVWDRATTKSENAMSISASRH